MGIPRRTRIGDVALDIQNSKPSRKKRLIWKRKLLKEKLPVDGP
jgi:hypothetical protein